MNTLVMTRTIEYRYNVDGKLVELTLWNEATRAQVTRWEYGVTKTESGAASNELVRRKVYPDSDDLAGGDSGMDGTYDRVEYRYNALGEVVELKDQNATVHAYGYDKLGRLVTDVVTELGEGIDGAVRAIGWTYNEKGQSEKVTSYKDEEMVEIVNEVQLAYDGFGQVTTDYQAHEGAVNVGTTPKVSYEYAGGGANNTARLQATIYPGNRRLEYAYGVAGSIDDLMDRVRDLVDGAAGPLLARYTKRGLNATVRVEYPGPQVELTYIKEAGEPVGDAGDQYTGLDRFNRIEDIRWIDRGGETAVDVDRYQYGFDRAGNRRWRRNVVAANLGLDEAYEYDGLYQLTGLDRGNLNINRTTVGGVPGGEEAFTYDHAGNWQRYVTRVGGVVELEQERRHNRANEITFIDGTNETVGYDEAGNMTRMPRVGEWNTAQENIWDAWNRLVKVEEGADEIGAYAYDGLTRRIWKRSEEEETEVVRHAYYSTQWQLLEERLDDSSAVEREFVWGMRYIDDLILRDSATFPSAFRIYAMHDQWHVTGLLHEDGDVIERYRYSAFGVPTVMDADWDERAESHFGWEIRYGAYRWDQETALYCVRYRSLHPDLGRWISRDPIGEEGGLNLLAYLSNSPLKGADVYGLQWPPPMVPSKPYWPPYVPPSPPRPPIPDGPSVGSPMCEGGGEPKYTGQNECRNCYTYAMQDTAWLVGSDCGGYGADAGCAFLLRGVSADGSGKGVRQVNCDECCKDKEYKIMLFRGKVSGGIWDFHFYRQDQGGTWSHQIGSRDPQNTDASGRPINDPREADRSHPDGGSYSEHCGCFCVPSKGVKLNF